MRQIHLAEGTRLQFRRRTEEFDQGVEIGMIVMLMDLGTSDFTRWISTVNLDLTRTLAKKMGYDLVEGFPNGGLTEVTLRQGRPRPKLELVHSRDEEARAAAQEAAPSLDSRLAETIGP